MVVKHKTIQLTWNSWLNLLFSLINLAALAVASSDPFNLQGIISSEAAAVVADAESLASTMVNLNNSPSF